ncbi:MAG: hypothetical protein K2H97_07105 [Prevotella sp.]|nr:hypothetical protein [Prevotella sp.]
METKNLNECGDTPVMTVNVDKQHLNEYCITQMERKLAKEQFVMSMLIPKLDIKPLDIIKRESPDFGFKQEDGKRIGVEVTDIFPVCKCEFNKAVENIVRKCLISNGIFHVKVNIIVSDVLYTKKTILKKNKLFERAVINALSGNIDKEYFLEFEVEPLGFKIYPPNKMPICVTNRAGFLSTVNDICVKKGIEHKEKKVSDYIKLNKEDPFDEYWLCLNLPDTESLYKVKGYHLPYNYKGSFSRIYISQEIDSWCHKIYPYT